MLKFTLEQATKAQRGIRVWLYSFFNLGAKWRWLVKATPPSPTLYPQERPGTHCIGGCVGPTADLDRCGKSHLPHRDSIPGPSRP